MPNLSVTASLAQDESFRNRLTAALVQGALAVVNAADVSGDDPDAVALQTKQRQLALAFVNEPWNYISRFAWIVAADDKVVSQYVFDNEVSSISDAAIENAVANALTLLGKF